MLATLGASVVELSASGAVNDGMSMLVAVAVPMIADGMDVSKVVAVAVPIMALGMVSVGRAKDEEEEMNAAEEDERKADEEENDGVVELD